MSMAPGNCANPTAVRSEVAGIGTPPALPVVASAIASRGGYRGIKALATGAGQTARETSSNLDSRPEPLMHLRPLG